MFALSFDAFNRLRALKKANRMDLLYIILAVKTVLYEHIVKYTNAFTL